MDLYRKEFKRKYLHTLTGQLSAVTCQLPAASCHVQAASPVRESRKFRPPRSFGQSANVKGTAERN